MLARTAGAALWKYADRSANGWQTFVNQPGT
jgi:hypothetical protein